MADQVGYATYATIPPDQPVAVGQVQDATIKKVANGFVCSIGCKIFVAKSWAELSKGLSEYWKDPIKAEKKFVQK